MNTNVNYKEQDGNTKQDCLPTNGCVYGHQKGKCKQEQGLNNGHLAMKKG